jgi:hypothetical protein
MVVREFKKDEWIDDKPRTLQVFSVTKDFVTFQSKYPISAGMLQWFMDSGWELHVPPVSTSPSYRDWNVMFIFTFKRIPQDKPHAS